MASAESPAGLVHVDRARRADTRKDVVAGLGQRVGGPREDRVDRAGADARSKQLLAELDEVAAADAVADRQHRDRGLIARPERALTDADGQLPAPPTPAARAAHALAAMFLYGDRDRRQLLDSGGVPGHHRRPTRPRRKRARSRTRGASDRRTHRPPTPGNNGRPLPSCPGWAPALRPDGSLPRRGAALGGSGWV